MYRTRTGALLRVDGAVAGAFDREHAVAGLPGSASPRELTLEVELAALPTHGLPSGPGPSWWWMQRTAFEPPSHRLDVVAAPSLATEPHGELPLLAHAHLDLAWLWTFQEGRRKALRTFANALQLVERDADYVFIQSQPAEYAGVERDDAEFFARLATAVRAGRIDASVAAPWVETDCNIPSGETLLRQFVYGMRYAEERFGLTPSVAWLPDSFGFANTLPQLLAHAGVRFFATTKLQWNDTTRWPHPQFVWRGPDGSSIVSAVIDAYEGDATAVRAERARARREPLVVGYGDGGGGPNDATVRGARKFGGWVSAASWFEGVALRADRLPRVEGELYLEFHRGIFTTHHGVKARRFALEGALDEAEELCAWCAAVRAPRAMTEQLAEDLRHAWPPLLRGDVHDVIGGTAIAPAYVELFEDYARCERIVDRVRDAARSVLPKGELQPDGGREIAPREDNDTYIFGNKFLFARVRRDGTVVELHRPDAPNLVTGANVLRAYVDKPKEWEAWNIDRGYEKKSVKVIPAGAEIDDDALVVRYRLRGSTIVLRIALGISDPYLRIDGAVLWEERRTLLRVENWLALDARLAVFGTPHGTVSRPAAPQTEAERAKFEAPGQRYARLDAPGGGFALLSTDNYGWSVRDLERGGVHLGLSLLRGPMWPDPDADRGEHRLAYALMPLEAGLGIGALEQIWRSYAYPPRVRLFTCADPAVSIVACKPADDGDGVIVRVRECDGASRNLRLVCGGRARTVESADARERKIEREVELGDGAIHAVLEPYELRTFRVRF